MRKMSMKVLEKLIDKSYTISFAESITGGALAAKLIENPGASHVIEQSFITYSIEAKNKYLGIDYNTSKPYKIVSKEIASQMADKLKEKTNATICIGITGNAGPGFDKDTDKLEAYFSIVIQNRSYQYRLEFSARHSRKKNINTAVKTVYKQLYELIK